MGGGSSPVKVQVKSYSPESSAALAEQHGTEKTEGRRRRRRTTDRCDPLKKSGYGKVDGVGGGQDVAECRDCAKLCDQKPKCKSYECSPSVKKCALNEKEEPLRVDLQVEDYAFCVKLQKSEIPKPMNIGVTFTAPGYVSPANLNDLKKASNLLGGGAGLLG